MDLTRHVAMMVFTLCLQLIDQANGDGGGDGTSAKPVKIHTSGYGGSLFLERFFQVVTVILLTIIVLLFVFTVLSVLLFCCHARGKAMKEPYESVSTQIVSEKDEIKL